MTCNIVDPITRESYGRDPRGVARAAEAYVQSTGLADTAFFGPEAEFFIFDDVRFDGGPNFGFYEVDSIEGRWNSGADEGPNLGYKPRYKEGYFPVPPTDKHQDMRSEMILTMEELGLNPECQHHEVGTGGQAEIDLRFAPLVEMADAMMLYKYIIKNTAARHGKTVTFMPKPLFEGQRQRHAHAPFPLEGRSASLRGRTATPACPTWRLHAIAACSSTRRRCSPSRTRRRTATSGSCRASRRR